jgi:hypothetical protein
VRKHGNVGLRSEGILPPRAMETEYALAETGNRGNFRFPFASSFQPTYS